MTGRVWPLVTRKQVASSAAEQAQRVLDHWHPLDYDYPIQGDRVIFVCSCSGPRINIVVPGLKNCDASAGREPCSLNI